MKSTYDMGDLLCFSRPTFINVYCFNNELWHSFWDGKKQPKNTAKENIGFWRIKYKNPITLK